MAEGAVQVSSFLLALFRDGGLSAEEQPGSALRGGTAGALPRCGHLALVGSARSLARCPGAVLRVSSHGPGRSGWKCLQQGVGRYSRESTKHNEVEMLESVTHGTRSRRDKATKTMIIIIVITLDE